MGTGVSILIVDDHPAVREGLALLLGQDQHVVCGEAASREELLPLLDSISPDLALVDLSLGDESGLACLPDLLSRNCPSIVYSMHEDARVVKRALEHGANGFVSKRETSTVLLEAIQTVLGGEQYLAPRIAEKLEADGGLADTPEPLPQLSEREREILVLLAKGETNADIASTFDVSIRTVETYYSRIQVKLDLKGMKALRKYALREYKPF